MIRRLRFFFRDLLMLDGLARQRIGTIKATLMVEDRPEFEREYRESFSWGRASVTCRWAMFGGRDWGFVRVEQSDGRSVLARHCNLADEIIFPHVLADVEAFIQRVRHADDDFCLNGQTEFTDRGGRVWVLRR